MGVSGKYHSVVIIFGLIYLLPLHTAVGVLQSKFLLAVQQFPQHDVKIEHRTPLRWH